MTDAAFEIGGEEIPVLSTGEQAYERIKHDIVFGVLQPGQRLPLDRLKSVYGVGTDLTVTGVSIVKASDTAGLGSKVIDNEATSAGTGALDQFVGKSGAGTLVVKQIIDAVTGATVSTKGVTKGVNAALAAAEAMN